MLVTIIISLVDKGMFDTSWECAGESYVGKVWFTKQGIVDRCERECCVELMANGAE